MEIFNYGSEIFGGTILPPKDNTYDLGSVALSWRNVYFETAVYATSVVGNWSPSAASTYTLGLTTAEWQGLYLGDDAPIYFGLGQDAQLLFETADSNARCLVLGLPTGAGNNIPYLVLGDASVINKDLALFNGATEPALVIMASDEAHYIRLSGGTVAGISSDAAIDLMPNSDTSDYFTFTTTSDIPTITATGAAYLALGSYLVTGRTLAADVDHSAAITGISARYTDLATLVTGKTCRAGYFQWSVASTTPSNPTVTVEGIQGCAGSLIADESMTLRGGHFRTEIDNDTVAGATARTSVGCEMSARAAYVGSPNGAIVAESGTAFVGARIWMAPYFTAGTVDNVNNFWGLWIYGEHATQRNADSAIKISDAGGGFTADVTFQEGSTLTDDGTSLTLAGAGLVIGTAATGLSFTGTYTGNVIDFTNVTIDHTGSNGPCLIRAGTYASPVSNADADQSGMIRLYSTTSATGTSYDRTIFACAKTTNTKGVFPVSGLAEINAIASGNGPTAVGASQFIAHMNSATAKLDARASAGLANFYGGWFKVAAEVGAVAASGSVVAPIWLDNQFNGTTSGEEYACYLTSGTHVDAVFGFEGTSGGHWDQLFYFDDTCYNLDPISGTSLKVLLNTTQYYIPLSTSATTLSSGLKLEEAVATDLTFSGFSVDGTAGATIAQFDLLYMGSDGKWEICDADAAASMPCLAMASAAIAENVAGIIILPGSYVRKDAWNWTVGGLLYADTTTAGGMVQTAPSGSSDVVQVVGYAVTADIIYFNPSLTTVEIA